MILFFTTKIAAQYYINVYTKSEKVLTSKFTKMQQVAELHMDLLR